MNWMLEPKGDQYWVFIGRTDAEAETPILWPPPAKSWLIGKDPDAGRDWGQEKKGTTGWDGWMASPTWRTWVWTDSGSWWWTGRPGVLWFMGSQRVGHDWVTELNWTELYLLLHFIVGESLVTICCTLPCSVPEVFLVSCCCKVHNHLEEQKGHS